jgi:hypothetical protein
MLKYAYNCEIEPYHYGPINKVSTSTDLVAPRVVVKFFDMGDKAVISGTYSKESRGYIEEAFKRIVLHLITNRYPVPVPNYATADMPQYEVPWQLELKILLSNWFILQPGYETFEKISERYTINTGTDLHPVSVEKLLDPYDDVYLPLVLDFADAFSIPLQMTNLQVKIY